MIVMNMRFLTHRKFFGWLFPASDSPATDCDLSEPLLCSDGLAQRFGVMGSGRCVGRYNEADLCRHGS